MQDEGGVGAVISGVCPVCEAKRLRQHQLQLAGRIGEEGDLVLVHTAIRR